MSKIKLYDKTGQGLGEMDLPDAVLERDKGDQAVHEAVVAAMAVRRRGTASTLSKGEVAGSNRKPWRQKGTGRARAGLRQSPVWRGGGVAFGPKPRSYAKKVNRKVARLALRRAFSAKVDAGALCAIEQIELEQPRTKLLAQLLKQLGVERSCLILVDRIESDLARASRNLPRVKVVRAADLDVYELMRHQKIVASKAGIEALTARLGAQDEVTA